MFSQIREQVAGALRNTPESPAAEAETMNRAMRLLAKARSNLIAAHIVRNNGLAVWEGPFAGMTYNDHSTEGCHVAKLLGVYEQPLHGAIEALCAPAVTCVLNIGSAEGYYAVGLARRMPWAQVRAHDADPKAPVQVAALAAKNGVADRVTTGGLVAHADFEGFDPAKTLLICDIEGAEWELLDPAAAPTLKRMTMVVESHEILRRGVTKTLLERFTPTHNIRVIEDDGMRALKNPPNWFKAMAHLDQLLAVWEWRTGPTPWLVMTPR